MQVFRFRETRSRGPERVVTIGNFDGVHIGHQALIRHVVAEAGGKGLESTLVTFNPHPQAVLHQREVPVITGLNHRLRLFRELGLDEVVVIPFTRELAATSAEEFVQTYLLRRFSVRRMVIGYDFAFGHNREGTAAIMEQFSQKHGFAFEVFPAVTLGEGIISSSRIREALARGDFELAGELLGRPFSVWGPVVAGQRRGREIGFPTLNLEPEAPLALPHGVYAVHARLGEALHRGVSNYGVRPTLGAGRPVLETHLFDFEGERYGESLEVIPLRFLRPEHTFENIAALRAQISRDSGEARAFLANHRRGYPPASQ